MIPSVPFKKHPILGHTSHFAADTLGFVLACANKGLPMARARIAFRDFLILLEPEAIRQVLQKNHRNYVKSFAYQGLQEFLGEGLLTAEGDSWLQNRRRLQVAFHRKEIANMEQAMKEVVAEKLEQLSLDTAIDLQPMFLEWTRDILLKALFGLEPASINGMGEVHRHLWFLRTYANDRMKKPLMAPPSWPTRTNRQFRQSVKALEGIILQLFYLSRQDNNKGVLVKQMLEALKKGDWTDQQVFDEIITLFLAGQETTTNGMIFLIHQLLQHPHLVQRIADEGDDLNWEHFIMEVLRMYPPVWAVSREMLDDDVLLGEKVEAGTTVFLSIYAMHRHPEFWNDPDEFLPDRFLKDYPQKAYMPFGLGPRICIGNHFALMEMKIMAETLVRQYDIVAEKEGPLELITPMTMGPKHPYKVRFFKKA
ncbi:MAG: cytochrome P450 [Chitinophagales bacterium]|nr:cytochrome P450 [Chitinophagales bacterium]